MTDKAELDAEDTKLVTLARGARGRVGAAAGAALRDETGRTYSGAGISLPSLTLGALQLVVAQAVSAGARGCECAVVVNATGELDESDVAALRDLGGPAARLILVDPRGEIVRDLGGPAGDQVTP